MDTNNIQFPSTNNQIMTEITMAKTKKMFFSELDIG
jgi:hypothetical protein